MWSSRVCSRNSRSHGSCERSDQQGEALNSAGTPFDSDLESVSHAPDLAHTLFPVGDPSHIDEGRAGCFNQRPSGKPSTKSK